MSLFHHGRGLLAALVLPLAAVSQPVVRYDQHQLVEVMATTQPQIDQIQALGAIILNCHFGPGRLDVVATQTQVDAIQAMGLETQLRIANVQEAIDAQVHPRSGGEVTSDPFADFFLSYHPYDGDGHIVWFMNELVTRYPAYASMVNVGSTLQGRTIWGIRVTAATESNTPAVLYFGGQHAREWITTTVPTYLAQHLLANYVLDPVITDLMNNVEFFLVPVFNVDGYVYSWTTNRLWRKNRRGGYGVDINRNWAQGWGGPGSSGVTTAVDYRGTAPFSEPETQALRDFIIAHPNLRAQLDVHSYSQRILWPLGYTPTLSDDHAYYDAVGSAMQLLIASVHGTLFSIGPVYTSYYPASGNSLDWTYTQRGMLSMAFECRDTGQYNFLLPPEQIIPSNEELVPAILHMTNSEWVRLPARFQFPLGLPLTVTPGQPTNITVEIVEQTDQVDKVTPRMLYRFDPAATFSSVPLSPLGGSLYQAVLPPTNCTAQPEFYFAGETVAQGEFRSPREAPPAAYAAIMETGRTVFFADDLSDNPFWSTQGLWQYGQPTGGGGEVGFPDPTSGYTGLQVYGHNLFGDYPNNLAPQYLTSPPFDCTGRANVKVEFARWLGVETPTWDHASVEASADGLNWTSVWKNTGDVTDSGWTLQSIRLSAIADHQPAVRLRWKMGPTDSAFRYCGWNIDDIALTAGTCDQLFGDFDANGDVSASDYAQFEGCFSGDGVPRGPNCGIFDKLLDGDVDCDDWVEFHGAWTGPGDLPDSFPSCEHRNAPNAWPVGARYLAIATVPGDEPVALRVTSPEFACLDQYVELQLAQGATIGRLTASPVFKTPQEWGTVLLGDAAVAPGHAYSVRTVSSGGVPSLPAVAQTLIWGDTGVSPGIANIIDVGAVADRIKGVAAAVPLAACDFQPRIPDYLVNVMDLAFAADAVMGNPFPYPLPCP